MRAASFHRCASKTRTSRNNREGPFSDGSFRCVPRGWLEVGYVNLALLLGVGGLRGLFRCSPLDIELFGVRGLQPRTFDFVAAREGLDLTTFGLLFAEVDRDQRAFAADQTDGRLGLAHRHKVHRG